MSAETALDLTNKTMSTTEPNEMEISPSYNFNNSQYENQPNYFTDTTRTNMKRPASAITGTGNTIINLNILR